MSPANFRAELLAGHKGNAALVPFDPGARWSIAAQPLHRGRRGFPVRAALNGIPFDGAIVPRSRKFWLLVPADVSAAAEVAVGAIGTFMVAPADSPPAGATGSRPRGAG